MELTQVQSLASHMVPQAMLEVVSEYKASSIPEHQMTSLSHSEFSIPRCMIIISSVLSIVSEMVYIYTYIPIATSPYCYCFSHLYNSVNVCLVV